jgi:hypothetical protein
VPLYSSHGYCYQTIHTFLSEKPNIIFSAEFDAQSGYKSGKVISVDRNSVQIDISFQLIDNVNFISSGLHRVHRFCTVIIIFYTVSLVKCLHPTIINKRKKRYKLYHKCQLRRVDFGFSIPPLSMSTIEEPLYGELPEPEPPRAYLGIFVVVGLGGVGYGLRV